MRRLPVLTAMLGLGLTLVFSPVWAESGGESPSPTLVTPKIIKRARAKRIDREGKGQLFRIGEHLVCVMEGTAREMGFQHGRLLAKQCRHILKEGYAVKALWNRGYTREYVNAQSERMQKFFPPEYIEEMEGIVEGLKAAGVTDISYEEIRLGVTQAEILHYDPGKAPGSGMQCSNFAVWGQWTSDGRLLHGRNLDWNVRGDAQDDAVILVWRPDGGIPFMMVGWAGAIGSVSGMNAEGLTFGEMTSMSSDATYDGLPLLLIMRRVLEKARTLDEALDIMQKTPRTTGWNYVLGDSKMPSARALEVDAKDCVVFGPMDPKETEDTGHWAMEDAVRRTNHPVGRDQLQKLIVGFGPRLKEELGVELSSVEKGIPMLKMQNSWQRYDWMGKQIQSLPRRLDIPEALQILANGPVRKDNTLHSWVFDPSRQKAYVAIAGNNPPVTASSRPYTMIALKEWFKRTPGS